MTERLKNINSCLPAQNRVQQLRRTSKLNVKQFANALIPPVVSKHFGTIYKMILDNPHIFQHTQIQEFTQNQLRYFGVKQSHEITKLLNLDLEKDSYKLVAALYAVSCFGIDQAIKYLIHYSLYVKTLIIFQSNQYHREHIKRGNKWLDEGSFSLTQLYHGSFSRGMGTQATYDKKTDEFVVTTNGEQGMKILVGATGQRANKTVMWSQLIVDGVNYGPHVFLMALRDEKTHQVLPGIRIGDLGPKSGINAFDNGYIILDNVRIPGKALLGKLGHIDENGKYVSIVKNNQQRFGRHMSPLSTGRALIANTCLSQSIAALTIAIRFACQRRQFKTSQNQPQKLIIDYPITRNRLLVPLAINIITYFATFMINKLYIDHAQSFTDPTKKIVAELHAASAIIKVKTTWFTRDAITQCRESMGGHGYSGFNGFNRFYHDNDANSTGQGDNNVLMQQTSKYVLRAVNKKENGTIINFQFVHNGIQLGQHNQKSLNDIMHLKKCLQDLFTQRFNAAGMQILQQRENAKNQGIKPEDIEWHVWNKVQPFFCNQLSLTYGDLIYFQWGFKAIDSINQNDYNRQFLENCFRLWAQHTLLKASFDNLNTRKILQKLIVEGCDAIYPDCIAATDALAPPSQILGSPFANQDGEGMKDYLNLVFSSKNAFGRVPWFNKLLKMRENP